MVHCVKYSLCSVCMCSDYETPQLSATADNTYEILRLSSPYETVRSTAISTGTAMYASILEPSMAAVHENSAAEIHENSLPAATATAAVAAAVDNNDGYEILKSSSAYETLPVPTTTSNGTDGYRPTRLGNQLAVPGVHENSPPAATAAGVDSDCYEISIPTEKAQTHSHAYIEILPNTSLCN